MYRVIEANLHVCAENMDSHTHPLNTHIVHSLANMTMSFCAPSIKAHITSDEYTDQPPDTTAQPLIPPKRAADVQDKTCCVDYL